MEVLPYAVQAYNSIFRCGYDPQDIRIWNMRPDILVHGSPCQDFTNEGKNDINSGRSILYERTLQILDPNPASGQPELTARPKIVIWENVPGLLYRHKEHLDHYLETMEGYGYHNYYSILSAADYDIPQDRERLYTVSLLTDQPFEFPKPVKPTKTLRSYIDTTIPHDAYPPSDAEKAILFDLPDGTHCVKEGTTKGYKEYGDFDIVNLAFPSSKTRRGRVGKNLKTVTTGPRQAVCYDGKLRMLTAKEYLRLMGYSERDYNNMVKAGLTPVQITSLAGNSICVPVLESIFWQISKMGIISPF